MVFCQRGAGTARLRSQRGRACASGCGWLAILLALPRLAPAQGAGAGGSDELTILLVVAALVAAALAAYAVRLRMDAAALRQESARLAARIGELEAGIRKREGQAAEAARRAEELSRQVAEVGERAVAEDAAHAETRKQLEAAREQFQTLFDSEIAGMYRVALDSGKLIDCNEQFARIVGYAGRAECLEKFDPARMVAGEDARQRLDLLLGKRGRIKDYEVEVQRADGRRTWCRLSAHRIEAEARLEGMLIDVTAQREAAEALHTTERLYRILADHSTDVIFLLDQDRHITYLSPSVERLLGYKPEDARQVSLQGLLTPPSLRVFNEALATQASSSDARLARRVVLEFVKNDDSNVWAEVVLSIVYGTDGIPEGFQGIARDITERRRAERAMRESEQRFRLLAENVPGVIYLRREDKEAELLYLNDWIKVVTGYPKEEFLEGRMKLTDLVHPDDLTPLSVQIRTSLLSHEPFHLVYRLRNSKGEYRWVEEYGTGVLGTGQGDEGNLVEGFLSDITERRQAETRLWESEERFRQLAENINGIFWLLDWETRTYDYVNPAFEHIFGRPVRDLLANPALWQESVHPDEREEAQREFLRAAETGEPREYRIVRPDGTIRNISDRCFPVRDRFGNIVRVTGFAEDITERRLAEQALTYRTRIERLLAGISSRFLNPSYDDADLEFRQALQTLGEFLTVDRCFVIEVTEDTNRGRMSYDWCAPSITSIRKERQSIDLADSTWVGHQLHEFRAVVVADIAALPAEAAPQVKLWREENTSAYIGVPLIWKHRLFGVLGCSCVGRSRAWTVNDQHLLRTAGEVFVNALQNHRADEALKMSEVRYRELFENANDMIFTTDLQGNLLTVNRAFLRVIGFDRDDVIGKPLENFVAEDHREQTREALRMQLTGTDTMTRQLVDFLTKDEQRIPVEIASRLMYRGEEAVGVQAIARDMTEQQKFQKQLEELAQTDALTGANNRRHFSNLGDAELNRAKRYKRSIAVLMMDIDHFKKINDTYGHDAGDKVLKRLTTMCVGSLRTNDIFGRLGGEEFAAVLPEATEPVTQMLSERLRLTLANTEVNVGDKVLRFTVSIGYALLKNPNETLEDLLNRADEALYQAKRMGRNRVVAG